METTFYTVAAQHLTVTSTAPAYDQPVVHKLVCLSGQSSAPTGARGKVIDFNAWKQEHTPLVSSPEPACQPPAPRPAASGRFLMWGEWAATLAVLGTMAVLMWRILVA